MKYLILYGNCQSFFLYEILSQLPVITARWNVVFHSVWAAGEDLERDLSHFEDCDVLLLQDVSNWHQHPRAQSIPPQTKVIHYPFCRFLALWPFNGNDRCARVGEGEAQFVYFDHLLERLRTETPDPEERYQRYLTLDVDNLPDIQRYRELEEDRLLEEDEKMGYTLGRWILDHYQNERLFHTISHPTPVLWQRMAEELLHKLDIEVPTLNGLVRDFAGGYQVPLHPKVISGLGLTWVDADTQSCIFHSREYLTFEQYVRRYIRVYS